VVTVVGEPGVGKSRLFWEFTRSPRTQGWFVLESQSVSYGKTTALLPLALLRVYFQIEAHDETRTIREKVRDRLLALDRALEPSLPALLWLLDVPVDDPQWQPLDPSQRRQHMLDGVKRLLLRESQVQPLVLVFEDLHWIDADTQAFLDSLVTSLPRARVLLLVNHRPEYSHGWGSCGIGAPGRPVSEYGRLRRGDGNQGRGNRGRRAVHIAFALALQDQSRRPERDRGSRTGTNRAGGTLQAEVTAPCFAR
jgi:predicted ATPase